MQISEKNHRENPTKIKDKSSFARLRRIKKQKKKTNFFQTNNKLQAQKTNNTK